MTAVPIFTAPLPNLPKTARFHCRAAGWQWRKARSVIPPDNSVPIRVNPCPWQWRKVLPVTPQNVGWVERDSRRFLLHRCLRQ